MKRARYLTGAIGMAPAAVALAMGPAAHAATVTGHAKTAPGRADARHLATLTAESSATSSAQTSPAGAAGGGCDGNTAIRLPRNGNVRAHLWYENSTFDARTCIGTLVGSLYFTKNICKDVSVSVSSTYFIPPPYVDTYHAKICGTDGNWTGYDFDLHNWYWHNPTWPILVKVKSTYGASTTALFGS